MLALMMQNCPQCNEPTAATDLRLDHGTLPLLTDGNGQLRPLCCGAQTLSEALRIEIRHSHAQDEERGHVVREVVSKADAPDAPPPSE